MTTDRGHVVRQSAESAGYRLGASVLPTLRSIRHPTRTVLPCATERTVAVDSPNGLSVKPGFSLQRRLLNDFISKNPLRRVSLLQGLAGGG